MLLYCPLLIVIIHLVHSTYPNDQYLTHYWPICNGKMNDHVGGAHMTQGANTSFTNDKNANPNSALALNNGWTRVPAGVYFNTPRFTISVWIFPQLIGSWARLIDFGNGANNNNIVFAIGSPTNKPAFQICSPSVCSITLYSSTALTLSTWQFLTLTYDGANFRIYINAIQTASSSSSYVMPSITRTSNLIGKSNMGGTDQYSSSYIDDLRIYNASFVAANITSLMNAGRNCFFYLKIHN
jgi:hypothetical protein